MEEATCRDTSYLKISFKKYKQYSYDSDYSSLLFSPDSLGYLLARTISRQGWRLGIIAVQGLHVEHHLMVLADGGRVYLNKMN